MAPPPPLPTGCYKCGRPGHWSRDCPSAPNSSKPAAAAAAAPEGKVEEVTSAGQPQHSQNQNQKKKKKERAVRPKLTPDLLLSDDGLGFVLRYFPKAFRPRARPGHEVEDLGNLIRLYTDWHSRLIPYYSFEQFIRNVEKVGASNRVRRCVSELRERVARGGDPTQLHEPPTEEVMPEGDPDGTASEDPFVGTEALLTGNLGTESVEQDIDPPIESTGMDPMQEDLLNEIYVKAADAPEEPHTQGGQAAGEVESGEKHEGEGDGDGDGGGKVKMELTEEQRARMEANRLRALERAAARAAAQRS